MKEQKKNNKGLICLVVVLLIAVVGLTGYILVDKDIIKLKKEEKKVEEKTKKEETDNTLTEDESLSIEAVDFNNCLNHDDVEFKEYTYYYEDEAFKPEISKDKKTVTLYIDWSSEFGKTAKMLGAVDENENSTKKYIITGFKKNVKEVLVGTLGQSWSELTIFYLMEDGTVYYSYVFKVVNTNDVNMNYNDAGGFDAVGPISDITGVVKLYRVQSGISRGGSWITVIGAKEDGSFYDLSVIKNFIHHE